MSIRMRLREERAQATVEMAVVTPVLLVLALIVYNVMIFAGAVARFDRVVPDIVLAHARHAGTASGCRQRPVARHGVSTLLFGPYVFYGLSHRHRLHRSRRQYPRALRKRSSLAHVLLPRRLGRTRASFNHCFDSCSPTRAGLRIGDSGLSSYEIG